MTAADDTLPKRFFEERLEDSGKVLLKSDFDRMLADYYRIKGWDKVLPSSSSG
jgi:aldehyde:ferredoxin oxidoreductase